MLAKCVANFDMYCTMPSMIGVNEILFFVHVVSGKGLKADQSKIEAIVNLDPPDCKAKLETLLGMVQYMSKFASHLANITVALPFRERKVKR